MDKNTVSPDPFEQFALWYAEARAAEVPMADAMALATADAQGRPSARTVLLKRHGAEGFDFYTNYDSPKGICLLENPQAALMFYWQPMNRQVRIEGRAAKLPHADSEAYFHSRPRESQLAAWASPQSGEIESRAQLLDAYAAKEKECEGGEVPLPPFWGGYRLVPDMIEFWQAADHRLHRRVQYGLEGDVWRIAELGP